MLPEPDFSAYKVSRETREKLVIYQQLLHKWQKAVNLVSPASLTDSWGRHFVDSMQLTDHIPGNTKTLTDMGSGAGFPGLVLAIMHPDIDVHLIESDHKKCTFLSTVSRETDIPVNIHNTRIEAFEVKVIPDIITARALGSLTDLCAYAGPFADNNPSLMMLFLKGEKAQQEIEKARELYTFDLKTFPSKTDPAGCVLHISNLCKKSEP